jgi:FAD binding domain
VSVSFHVSAVVKSTKNSEDGETNDVKAPRNVDIPRDQLFQFPESEVTVARARSIDELGKLLKEAEESGSFVAVKRSVPKTPLSLPRGSVCIVLDEEFSEFQGSKVSSVTLEPPVNVMSLLGGDAPQEAPSLEAYAPCVKINRLALGVDIVTHRCQSESFRHSFLPLALGPDKAVLSELFDGNDPRHTNHYFQRSARPISDRVQSYTYVPMSSSTTELDEDVVESSDGAKMAGFEKTTWTRDEGTPLSFHDKLVIDATLQVDPSEAKMTVRRVAALYDDALFQECILDAFNDNYPAALKTGVLDDIDLTVEVFNKPIYFTSQMFVVITACSTTRKQDDALQALFPKLDRFSDETQLLADPISINGMETGVPEGAKAFNLQSEEYGEILSTAEFRTFSRTWLSHAVRAAAADTNQNILAHFRLLPKDDVIYAGVTVFEPDPNAVVGWTQAELDSSPRFPESLPTGLRSLGLPNLPIPTARRAVATDALTVEPSVIRTIADDIPGLEGIEIIRPNDKKNYDDAREQYASYKGSYPDSDFQPIIIAVPNDASEIARIVDYAASKGKKVVVRSGGHQYCGFSSGDSRYVQVLMDNMKYEDLGDKGISVSTEKASMVRDQGCSLVSPDGPTDEALQWFVTVAPRTRLRSISQFLLDSKLTIPHGECPLVGIGGHVQTGGYGHQLRGLGLCLDYVYSFDIVVRPSKNSPARLVTVYRPELDLTDAPGRDEKLNGDLYKGVLGGSPGAFGVLTRIKFLAVHDNDPALAECHNSQGIFLHRTGPLQKGATQAVRTMLKYTPTLKLQQGLDVFISIVSMKVAFWEFGVVLPELAYTGAQYTNDVEEQITDFEAASKAHAIFLLDLPTQLRGQPLAARPPSVVAHKGVRSMGTGVTELGREFDFPYKKRVNLMLNKLPEDKAEEFAKEFGILANDVVRDSDLKLVIQMLLGGGRSKSNDVNKHTGLPYRAQEFLFVFDVFYRDVKDENRAVVIENRAVAIQTRMHDMLEKIGGFDNRVFWGSFGREKGETDMSKPHVQGLYYESNGDYRSMQDIKEKLDPSGLFTTEFTVQNRPRAGRFS